MDATSYPVAVENIGRALIVAFDMSNEAVQRHITAYAKPRTKENKQALYVATSDSNEAYKAYVYISRLHDRIWDKYVSGNLAVDYYNQLQEDIYARMDVEMMSNP